MKLFKSTMVVFLSCQLTFGASVQIADKTTSASGAGLLQEPIGPEDQVTAQDNTMETVRNYVIEELPKQRGVVDVDFSVEGFLEAKKNYVEGNGPIDPSMFNNQELAKLQNAAAEATCPTDISVIPKLSQPNVLRDQLASIADKSTNCTARLYINFSPSNKEVDKDQLFDDFCGCVYKNNSDTNYPSTKEAAYKELNDKHRDEIMANKVGMFLIKLKSLIKSEKRNGRDVNSNPFKIEDFNDRACSPTNVASKLANCFTDDATAIIDDKYIDKNFFQKAMSTKTGRAQDTIERVFKDSIDNLNNGRNTRREKRDTQINFFNLFFKKFVTTPDLSKNPGKYITPEYSNEIDAFVHSNTEMRTDYTLFIASEARNLGLKQGADGKFVLSDSQKARLNFMFALSVYQSVSDKVKNQKGRSRYKDLLSDTYKTDENSKEAQKLLKRTSREVMGFYNDAIANMSNESCGQELEQLEFACNEENYREFFKDQVSLYDFIGSAGVGVGEGEVPLDKTGLYCHAVNIGAIDRDVAVVDNSSSTSFEKMSSERLFPSSFSSNKSSDSKSKLGANRASGFGTGGMVTNNAANIINGKSPGNVAAETVAAENADGSSFTEAANVFSNISNSNSAMLPSSSVIDSNSLSEMMANPSVNSNEMSEVKDRIEGQMEKVQSEISQNEKSNAISTEQLKENDELKSELAALKEQLAQINSAISKKDDDQVKVVDEDESRRKIQGQQTYRPSTTFSGSSRGDSSHIPVANRTQTASNSSGGATAAIPTSAASASGSFSSAGAGVSGINKLGATGGLSLQASSKNGASISGGNIAKVDQSLVAKAISEGSNKVVLADGRIYYIGQDEEGNVVLSETADEVIAGVVGPEEEGPQLPKELKKLKVEEGPARAIASEPESEVKGIYLDFMNDAKTE